MEQLFLKAVQINNFRNIQNSPIFFERKINIFYGLNANGKTNVLEAIYYILKQKSFKKEASFDNIISIDSQDDSIKFTSLFKEDSSEISFSGRISPGGKESFINGKKTTSKIQLNPIFLNPFDSYLFFSNSSFRKRTIDYIVTEIFPAYKKELLKYTNILKQRNAVISQRQAYSVATALDEEYAKSLLALSEMRRDALDLLANIFISNFKEIFNSENEVKIEFINSFCTKSAEEIKKSLKESKELDLKSGFTKINLNNEDLKLTIDGNDFKYNSSFGQQKIAYISLVLATSEVAEKQNKTKQILLIDDLSNEIDHAKLINLFRKLIKTDKQVVITTANYKINEALKQFDGINYREVQLGKILQ